MAYRKHCFRDFGDQVRRLVWSFPVRDVEESSACKIAHGRPSVDVVTYLRDNDDGDDEYF